MQTSKWLQNILAIFCGAVLWRQYELFQYFYNSKADDIIFLSCLGAFSSFLSYKYISLTAKWQFLFHCLVLIVGIGAAPLGYHTFQNIDLLSSITYFFVLIASVGLSARVNNEHIHSFDIVLIIFFLLIGGFCQLFIGGVYFISIIAFIFLIVKVLTRGKQQLYSYSVGGLTSILIIALSTSLAQQNYDLYSTQSKYFDKVILSIQTPFQSIDITEWKGQKWFYYNGINNFSTIDEWLYYEPLVHPAMLLSEAPNNILVIGGDNGLAIREVVKHSSVTSIHHLQLDTALYNLATSNSLFTEVNHQSFDHGLVKSTKVNIFNHLHENQSKYDVIIVDIPDPSDIELNQYYTQEFYQLCKHSLANEGILITQAGSPYFATQAYYCIANTMKSVNLEVLPIHNQILTAGEWGWIVASKNLNQDELKSRAKQLCFKRLNTVWLNKEAMNMMLSFGKNTVPISDSLVNTLKQPIVHSLYTAGNWNLN